VGDGVILEVFEGLTDGVLEGELDVVGLIDGVFEGVTEPVVVVVVDVVNDVVGILDFVTLNVGDDDKDNVEYLLKLLVCV